MVAQLKYHNIPTGHHLSTIYSEIYRFDGIGVRQNQIREKIYQMSQTAAF